MKKLTLIITLLAWNYTTEAQTLSIYKSSKSVNESTLIVESVIKNMNLIFFETVDHDAIASKRGVAIGEMNEVLFEDGGLSSTLLQCQPTTALDLPLKILIWEENGDVYIAFMDPRFMKKRFMLSGCEEIVDKMGVLLSKVVVDSMRAIEAAD